MALPVLLDLPLDQRPCEVKIDGSAVLAVLKRLLWLPG